MHGASWWFRVGFAVISSVLSAMWLVWTVGGWATDAEIQAFDARTAQLEALMKAAPDEDKAGAQKTLDDHLALRPSGAPGWASLFPQDKIALGLDLQGGIDLELRVDIRKAVEAAADRYTRSIVDTLTEDKIAGATSKRLPGTADIAVAVPAEQEDTARKSINEKIGLFDYRGLQDIDGERMLVFGFQEDFAARLRKTALDQAVETIRNRIDKFGVTEPVILTKGTDGIMVQLPGLDDPQRAIDLVGRTAQLEFRMLYDESKWSDARVRKTVDDAVAAAGLPENYTDEQLAKALGDKIPADSVVLWKKSFDSLRMQQVREEAYLLRRKVDLTGDLIEYAQVARDQFNAPYVRMELNKEGAHIFSQLSGENVGKRMAIVLDDNVASAPVFQEKIPNGVASITLGDSDSMQAMKDAEDLVVVLRAGALPAPIEIEHNRTVGRTLGEDSVRAGGMSAIVAVGLVFLFMGVYYGASGWIANFAVVINIVMILGMLAGFGATLTLPGIAGIILTVGMAVDGNVIIFERMREELREGKSARAVIAAGYEKATWTILDANITTFMAGAVLYSYGSGPIKGFAVTLMIGILTTVYTSLYMTHVIYDWLLYRRGMKTLSVGI